MTELTQKQPRLRDPRYLAFLRTKPCCVCGAPPPSEAAHIRSGSTVYCKPPTGMAEKPDDRWAVPLCGPILGVKKGCHRTQHAGAESKFWRERGLNPFEIAIKLYAEGGHPNDPQPKRKPGTVIIPKGLGKKIPSRPFTKTQRGFAK